MAKLTLISLPTCPYVQRAVIALAEKEVPFDIVYVDLINKPDWFLALSPLGKVPVLKVERPGQEDAVVFESAVILEYIEETAGGAPLHPSDPLERAQHRSWMEFGSALLGDMFAFGSAPDEAAYLKARDVLAGKLKRLEGVVSEGPFFAGEKFSYVDAVFGPVFRQLDVMDTAHQHGLFEGLPKLSRWREALARRPSVNGAVPADFNQQYLGRLKARNSWMLQAAA